MRGMSESELVCSPFASPTSSRHTGAAGLTVRITTYLDAALKKWADRETGGGEKGGEHGGKACSLGVGS